VSELPKGWVKAKIKDVSIKCVQNKPSDNEKLVYVDIGSINRKLKVIENPQYLKGIDAPSRARKRINTNDVLVSLTRPNLNAIAHVPKDFDQQYASTGFEVIKSEGVDSRYLFALVKTQDFINAISGVVQGALYPAAKSSDVQNYEFPLAPLNEQIRIADKLDSMLAKVDAAQVRLDKIPNILKRFRQSVLAAATSGELTKEWRGGSEQQWPRVLLKSVGAGFNYGTSTKSKPEGDVPVLRMGNLQGGQLDWEKLVYTSDKSEIEKYLLEAGDVLFNRTNSPELVGKSSIFRGERKAIYAGYLIRVKGSERLNTEFLNIQLNSPHARDYCWQVKTDGVSQSNINAKKLQAYEFDLPKIDEQLEIVRRVGELFSHAGLFERQYQIAKKKCNRLTQSILAKAFRGQLVEQDENDEPAVKLLSRIQSEPKSQPKNIVKRPANKSVDKNMKLEDAPENYLKNLMPSDESEIQAKQLWQDSNMTIDDFYAQLKKELINIEEINNSLDPNARTLKTSKE
jgi:type I restriction enzyme S subunit